MKRYLLFAIPFVLIGCGPSIQPESASIDRGAYDPALAMKEAQWNEARVQRDPKGAIGWSQLSAAYLAVARQNDDNTYALKAEDAARKSLSLRRSNNANAAIRLAKAILEQHRFTDALTACDDALKLSPNDLGARELRAEILVELGRYDQAEKEYTKFGLSGSGLSGLVLKARLLQIDGKSSDAEVLLKSAAQQADSNWDMSRGADAWFHFKYGTLLSDEGKVSAARDEFQIAVETNPGDFKSMGALAKLAAASGDLSNAKMWAEKSVAVCPSVEVASLLQDISLARGDSDAATRYATMVDQVSHPDMYRFLQTGEAPTGAKPHTHDRLYAMYCADHKKNLPDALAAAQKDLKARQDVFAYDTMAWVLHQMGRDADALPYAKKALARGTQDAKMLYHAGMISLALGQSAEARRELSLCRNINPQFQFLQQDVAANSLKQLGGAI